MSSLSVRDITLKIVYKNMKTTKRIAAGITTLIGIFFLANSVTDIQLGFGIILIALSLLTWE